MLYNKSYAVSALAALLFCSSAALAQGTVVDSPQNVNPESPQPKVNATWQNSLVPDGVIDRTPHVHHVMPWQPIREADVMWKKRVWREIDTRQKQNMAFRAAADDQSGGGQFVEILIDAIKKGRVGAYGTSDDRFTTALTTDQIMEQITGKNDTIPVENPETGMIELKIIKNDFNPDLITRFRLKEDWYFDRNMGRMVGRIIGIAPLLDRYNEDGSFRAAAPMFWIYYPQLREVLAQYEVFNPENDMSRMNWDEFFENRYFASYVIKVSNPFDIGFTGMGLTGTDALYEGQRVNEMLFNKEHDMWVY
jgi:gliding motility associated protien GldN